MSGEIHPIGIRLNWDGGVYEGKIYGIWGWTDIRGIWYWKDLLRQADVDPELLKTWNGYIHASKRLNEILRPYGIEGMHLVGASHAPDMFYPYLWMLGGEIFEMKNGHPKHGSYWFPTFNSSEGVMALEFIKKQIDAGIKAQKDHFWGQEFVNRSFAVMIEGSWMPGEFPLDQWSTLGTEGRFHTYVSCTLCKQYNGHNDGWMGIKYSDYNYE